MRTYILPTSELRSKLAKVLASLKRDASPCFVTKNGRAVAALLPIEVYDDLISALEDRLDEGDADLAGEVRETRKEYKAGKTATLAGLKRLLKR